MSELDVIRHADRVTFVNMANALSTEVRDAATDQVRFSVGGPRTTTSNLRRPGPARGS
jgi:hypothetical protein